jgi:superfamily II DNA or RNA helicase
MDPSPFQSLTASIDGNVLLREPQIEAYAHLRAHYRQPDVVQETGVVLPVGCGKSGLITIAPFALGAHRVLVIAPGLRIAGQLLDDFRLENDSMFYRKCAILPGPDYPEPAEIRGADTNRSDLDEADVVITNIQQLQGSANKWLVDLPADYFDLIIFDEAHHNVAESWQLLRKKFPAARVVNVSATPARADGRLMAGEIIYSYPIYKAVQNGYVKHITGLVLNPSSLRYVRREDEKEVTVDLEEVRRLGEQDADFRRSIVSSSHTLSTIVDASIRELRRLRKATGEERLKIIASALNMEHCKQIVAAYQERGMRAGFIHSREDQKANQRLLAKLDRHELDVVVQVRMLSEGFDHKYLAVAAVFSIFANLSPFVQFVGRIMRVIEQNKPGAPVNNGVVVFHAGANTTARWEDFREFTEADKEWFRLLTDQEIPEDEEEVVIDPQAEASGREPQVEITSQEAVSLESVPLLSDKRAREALEMLRELGFTPETAAAAMAQLEPIAVSKQSKRRAEKVQLDEVIKTKAAQLLARKKLNVEGGDLDTKHLGRSNWVVVKAEIDKRVNARFGSGPAERHLLTQDQLDEALGSLDEIATEVEMEFFNGGT